MKSARWKLLIGMLLFPAVAWAVAKRTQLVEDGIEAGRVVVEVGDCDTEIATAISRNS